MSGHHFGNDAICNIAQFLAIAVSDHQQEADHSPEHRRFQRLRQLFAKQYQHQSAGRDDQHDLEHQGADIVPQHVGDGILIVAGNQRGERQRDAEHENPGQAAAHGLNLSRFGHWGIYWRLDGRAIRT